MALEDVEPKPPEITAAGAASWERGAKIALLAPDACAIRTWAKASGEALSVEELLRTRCGVDMAELEKALVRRGFGVSSWKAVEQLVTREGIAPLDAARRLGASVILQVNSFERSKQDPLKELRWETIFYESDKSGRKGRRALVPEIRAQALEHGLRTAQVADMPAERVGASLNVTAIDVRTGQSVWFFSRNHWQQLAEEQMRTEQLFLCNRRHLAVCFPRVPAHSGLAQPDPRYRSGSEGSAVSGRVYASALDAAYHSVAREVIDSLVDEFSKWSRGG